MRFSERVLEQEEKFRLNDTDDTIIEYIEKHRDVIHHLTIQKFAEDLYISPNTIMRTCKKLGYTGFAELKFSLQNEETSTDFKDISQSVFDKIPQSVTRTMDVVDEKILNEMTEHIIYANKVLIAGVGDSVYFCDFFGRYLRCLDKKAEFFSQFNDIEYASKFYKKTDLVFILNSAGDSEQLISLVNDIKSRDSNIPIFCLTHYGSNKLSNLCDKQLCFWGEKRVVNGYNITDRVGLIMIIRMLCETYLKKTL